MKRSKKKKINPNFKVKFRNRSLRNPTEYEVIAKSIIDSCLYENEDYFCEFIFQNRRFDFFIPKLSTAIEIDGGYHNTKLQKKKDSATDYVFFKKYNIKVIRIKNENVEKELPVVLNKFLIELQNNDYKNVVRLSGKVKKSIKSMKNILHCENQRQKRIDHYLNKLKLEGSANSKIT